MERKPTQQYLNYLVSTHVDVPVDNIYTDQSLRTLHLNSTSTSMAFPCGITSRFIQTNLCADNSTRNDSGV